ncbi:MAG: SusC/RagA family TonB-linked outer membrane protein, partial [Bacteroidales bacterium]|nr:SusC/RagA family TonB-linked outer membrane protein [Bacteroidales bacterium]
MQTKENVIRTGLQTVLIAGALLALNPPQATAAGAHENTLHALNQKNIVRCHVTDQNGDALIGVTVMPVSGKGGTVSDIDGNFTIDLPKDGKVTLSYAGYKSLTIKLKEGMTIKMEQDLVGLEDVVVIGYGTVKKKDLTGAVTTMKTEDITIAPTSNAMEALQGKVAGLDITKSSGQVGSGVSILLRGSRSIYGDNAPLFIIDGVQGGSYEDVNPSDIESIDVLKDASSTAIYGSAGANGVIIITTKRAKKGEAYVTFDATLTLQTYTSGLDLLDANQWGDVYWSAYKYAHNGATPSSSVYGNGATAQLQTYKNLNGADVLPQTTDWEDQIHRTALMQTYSIGLQKGAENGSSSLSLSWLDHDGIVKGTDFKRLNSRFSSDYGFLDNRLKAGGNVAVNWWTAHYMPGGIEENAVKQHPAKAVYDTEGVYVDQINDILGDTPNAMRLIENASANKNEYWRVFGNAYLQIEPIKNLIVKTNFGVNYYNETGKTFEPAWLRDTVNKLTQSTAKNQDWVWTNTAQYNIDLDKHSLMALAGVESKKYHNEGFFGYGTGLQIEDPNYLYLGNVTANKNVGAAASNYSMVSGFGKLNYTYDNKYLVSFTLRRDASSRLSKEHNYDWFPSVSAGWRLSQESFMEPTQSWLSNLKIRGSWGINGNDLIDNEAFYAKYLMSLDRGSYNMSGDGTTLAP